MSAAPPRVLVVEDEPAIADTVLYALRTEGFQSRHCGTAGEALDAVAADPPALIVLDVGLPDMTGFELCKRLRQRSSVPILFLTARSDEIDRVVGLEIGGDDYLTKPFSPRELTARVRAILRRLAPPREAGLPAPAPVWSIDEARCLVRHRGKPLDLTRYEYRLLKALAAQPGRVFSRDQLMAAAWEDPGASLDRTVDAHIKTLRSKLRAVSPGGDPIQTHRGLGYSLRETP